MGREKSWLSLLLALAISSIAPIVHADGYPSHTVRIIVPFGPAGPADIYARVIADRLSKALNQSFMIDNRPGAQTIVGTEAASRAPADGYTLLMVTNTHTTNETLFPRKPYQLMNSFVAVAAANYSDLVLAVKPTLPIHNTREFIEYARKNPGKLNFASSGTGSAYHMAGELFQELTKTELTHIPHRSSNDARNSLIGGYVDLMFDAVTTMAPMVANGQVRAIATTGQARSDSMPDIPTVAESGVPGYEAIVWVGLMAPAGTPREIVTLLNTEVKKVLSDPTVVELWKQQGAVAMIMTPEQFDEFLRKDIASWEQVIKANKIKIEE
jgi:tripartite-type tricarboxylate transporter receptor subunit TctC